MVADRFSSACCDHIATFEAGLDRLGCGECYFFLERGPSAMGPRFQRMARMADQQGVYLQIVRREGSYDEEYKEEGSLDCRRDLELIGGDRAL